MFVYRSNRLEELVGQLARVTKEQSLGIVEPETIVIQSAGMERYLSRELSRRAGIVANVQFPFPRAFFHRVLDRALGEDVRAQAYERESLTWAIYANLAEQVQRAAAPFSSVCKYLDGDADGSKRLLLAEKLAHLFDQYVTYRPRMVLGFQEGKAPHDFQAILFRELAQQLGDAHFAARCSRFMNELSDEELRAALPGRVSLMGGPGLPPLFLEMFRRIGQAVPCHVFSFSVCEEYFADAHPLSDPLPEVGEGLHPLLISLGKVGADFQHLLEMIGGYEEGGARFVPALTSDRRATVLSVLQQSLIEGRKEPQDIARARKELSPGLFMDDSITLDSCHSPLREVETLHDRLLGWFADDPTLRPEDVVVLAPRIEAYSPLISAVFSARAGEAPHIPFRIADRSEKFTNAAARALLLALSILRGRLKASELLDLLQLAPVRLRYDIQSHDLERIARWVSDAGIRWGIDGNHKGEWGLPIDDLNTWRFGLRRLLLGFALPDDGAEFWQGVVPLDAISVSDLDLVGRLCEFCENLFALRERLVRAGDAGLWPSEWQSFLDDLIGGTLAESPSSSEGLDDIWDTGAVRLAVHEMLSRAQDGLRLTNEEKQGERLGLRSMFHLLETELDVRRPSTDFLAGGVTFCALLPLRTIPFRVVCVVGLNQGEFPRADTHQQLDLMAASPKRGDRSLRADDRYLFLEVILAARERLSLSYVGRSVQDNTEKPPSVVVTELGLIIEQLLQQPEGAVPFLTPTEHPLQPFHPDYFRKDTARDDTPQKATVRKDTAPKGAVQKDTVQEDTEARSRRRLRSFDRLAFSGAEALASEPTEVKSFFDAPLPQNAGTECEITLEELVRFWKGPTQAFFEACGVRLSDEHQEVEDREPVLETGLSRFVVGDRLLKRWFFGEAVREDIELGRGELPVGAGGRVLLKNVNQAAREIFTASDSLRRGDRRPAVSFVLEWEEAALRESSGVSSSAAIPRVVLTGSLEDIHGDVRLETSYGLLNTSRKLGLWVRHLAACAAGVSVSQSALVVRGPPKASDGVEKFVLDGVPRDRAMQLLGELCALCLVGRKEPLRFFPEPSEAYFLALSHPPKKLDERDYVAHAFDEARRIYAPNKPGFRPDAIISELYRGSDPFGCLDTAQRLVVDVSDLAELPFARLAETVFAPLYQAKAEAAR